MMPPTPAMPNLLLIQYLIYYRQRPSDARNLTRYTYKFGVLVPKVDILVPRVRHFDSYCMLPQFSPSLRTLTRHLAFS